jgi:hypothetical protein
VAATSCDRFLERLFDPPSDPFPWVFVSRHGVDKSIPNTRPNRAFAMPMPAQPSLPCTTADDAGLLAAAHHRAGTTAHGLPTYLTYLPK